MKLDVKTDASIQLTAKLEKLHRSAFPSAVRNTLNDVAFETKSLIPKKAEGKFTIRQKNLFKRMSLVNKATGWNINNMILMEVDITGLTLYVDPMFDKTTEYNAVFTQQNISPDKLIVVNH